MSAQLTVTVLVENTPTEGLAAEHGLSLYLHYRQPSGTNTILLDFGQSDAFARNAHRLGIDLARVDRAVLSHAHYDHADGMSAFFAANDHAPLHLSDACDEICWSSKGGTADLHYIGIGANLLSRYHDRLSPVSHARMTTLAPGVHTVPHTTAGLAEQGKRAGMFLRRPDGLVPDDFAHELSLVIEQGRNRLTVFNSCSHAGLPTIVAEVQAAFPAARIFAYVGGLHLVHTSDEDVVQVAQAAQAAGIEQLWTGHCTGERAFELLKRELDTHVHHLMPGTTFAL